MSLSPTMHQTNSSHPDKQTCICLTFAPSQPFPADSPNHFLPSSLYNLNMPFLHHTDTGSWHHRSSAPSSPNSLDSAPMDESDSDSDAPQSKSRDDEGSKYPVEGLFMSHAEKAEIMAMREFEREQILAERKEEKERMRQNALLRQLVTNQENEEKKHKKRKASAADLEDGQRKTSRVRKETSSALDTLKRARAEKSERMRRRDERKERSPSFRIDDADASGDSDVEWAGPSKHKSRSPEIKEVPLAEFRDVERVRVGRSRFAEVCFFPGFDETITDCYVRINVGPDPDTRENVYRMAVIKGEVKMYLLASKRLLTPN